VTLTPTMLLLFASLSFTLRAAESSPCAANAAARQLDYWLGDWAVASPDAPGKGHSKVSVSLDECMVVESWGSDTGNHAGENVLAFNSGDKTWYGLFVDNHGRVHSLKGAMTPGAAELQGPAADENGRALLKRVRVVRVNPDKVEQIWEKSLDGGSSWLPEYRMEYLRKRP
jgi:hypothetical protein